MMNTRTIEVGAPGGESAGRAPAVEFRHHFATLLSASARALERGGKTYHEIPVALTGKWMKRGQEFAITLDDLQAMARNFAKRKNEQVVIDYEHASETPEVALGGPVPAAGWIHALRIEPLGDRGIGPLKQKTNDPMAQSLNHPILKALIEWTPEARRMIQDGQYRFFSPAIDWNYRDKETGEPQGATLTSGALTNHPFLEELPPLMLTDLGGSASILAAPSAKQVSAAKTPTLAELAEGEIPMKKLTLKPLTEGPQTGHHGVFDGDDSLGYLDSGEFADYAHQHAEDPADALATPDGAGDCAENSENSCPSAKLAERIGVTPATTFDELRRRLAVGAESEAASSRAVLLSEAARDGALDNAKAIELARDGRIALTDYIAAQEADRALGEAVRAGKILPRERKFFFRDALERPREFAEYVRHAAPRVPLGSVGMASGGPLGVDEEVRVRTESLMAEEKLSYSKALKKVFAGDHELATRYHSAHRRRLAGDAAGESAAVSGTE
ncbi:MAG TPA: phage protease [Terriglobia bacterium]|nr:phage protease [Terriglobia bacterium]